MDYIGGYITKNPVLPTDSAASGVWRLNQALQYTKAGTWPANVAAPISRSVRLRASASAYFNRTPASTTNRQIMTWSGWVKRGSLSDSGYMYLFGAYPGSSATDTINFVNGNLRIWFNGSTSADLVTTQVFRDPSAWYHIVVAIDTTQATAANRIKVYVNGSQVTAFSTATYPSQNYNTFWNNSSYSNQIGANGNGPASFFDGYLTEINFIDGQALSPTSFGAFDAITGVWNPVRYSGTYGTNGFYLTFSDNSAATATTIGKDSSGNGNNWTPNNISVTAGTTYDSMVDSPTNYGTDTGVGGEVRGNYAVLNPVNQSTSVTISNGNLYATCSANAYADAISTMPVIVSGKSYWEITLSTLGDAYRITFGLGGATFGPNADYGSANPGCGWQQNSANTSGNFYVNGSPVFTVANVNSVNDVFMFAYDDSTGRIYVGKNGSWFNSGSPASGTGYVGTLTTGNTYLPGVNLNTTSTNAVWFNFGQRAFSYTAPSGFKALCTQNLPTPTVSNGANYVAATTYAGNSSSQSLTNTVNSISFQPDLVWVKNRSSATNHYLWDSVRGVLKELYSNLTNAESTNTIGLSAFNSNGFTLNNGDAAWNVSGSNYVGWQWKGGGTAVTNTNGTITSSVSASTTAGFSVVTYTGNGTSGATIGHGLGATASFIILKRRDGGSGYSWYVQHPTLGPTKALFLDSTGTGGTSSGYWNNTAPTSNVFSVGNDTSLNANTGTYVAYCWSQITGYSAFGSYTGNGSSDGTFTYLGFRPRYVMIKRTDTIENWYIHDTSRSTYNASSARLIPNSSAAEVSDQAIDLLSNGFKFRTSDGAINASGGTYIYAAFAENPFKIARAR